MRILVAVDLAAETHNWLVERVNPVVVRTGGTVDVLYVQSVDADLALIDHHDTRLRGLVRSVPVGHQGRARLEASGNPEDVIVKLSRDYDMIVVGSREPNALERMLRGVMATRVMMRAHCPVLVPRGDQVWSQPSRVLLGVDIHGPVQDVLVTATGEWAARMGGTLHLVYAVAERIPTIRDPLVAAKAEVEWLTAHQEEIDALAHLMALVPEVARGECVLRRGDPEGVLVALSGQYDLVAVGNREREGLTGLLLGAVARAVVRRAHCDVLTLNTADDTAA
jgi:nucleotide-binding universal stress UspA family protein